MAQQKLKYIEKELRAFILSLPENSKASDIALYFNDKTSLCITPSQVVWFRAQMLRDIEVQKLRDRVEKIDAYKSGHA